MSKHNITATEFLQTIFEERDDDEVICVSKMFEGSDGKTGFWNVPHDHRAFRQFQRKQHDAAWYFCVSTVTGEWNEKETAIRRRRADVVRMHCLVLDDVGTKAAAPPVEPSWKLESSQGNFQWGYMLEPTDDVETYEAMLEWCHQQGWGDAGAGGSYRIMRVPGSVNMKQGRENFVSRVTEWNPEVWTLAELIEDFGSPDLDDLKRGDPRKMAQGGGEVLENIDPLLDWLQAENMVVQDDGGEWVDVICPWADAHTTGANTAGYSPLGRGVGRYVQTRAFHCMHEHCRDRSLKDFIKKTGAPRVSGYDPIPWLQRRYVYVVPGSRIVDMEQRPKGGVWIYERNELNAVYPGRVQVPGHDRGLSVMSAFVENPDTIKADNMAYCPGREDVCVYNDQVTVNMYVEPTWAVTDKTPSMFLQHMEFLLPDSGERSIFLDWLAYKIQNPQSRSYAVAMIAEGHGTGRGWLRQMLTRMLQGKVNSASLMQLIGRGTAQEQNYNDWMARCQFVVVEEAKDQVDPAEFYHAYEGFKTVVDTRTSTVRINPKYGRQYVEDIYFNALIFSNHADALAIPENDRRVAVFRNPEQRADRSYYDKLEVANNDDEAAALYWYLKRRDVSGFDHVYPPMTQAKKKMMGMTVSPSDEIEKAVVESIPCDLVTMDMLHQAVREQAKVLKQDSVRRAPDGVTRRMWRKLGAFYNHREDRDSRFRLRLEDGSRVEVRVLRNKSDWLELDAQEMQQRAFSALQTSGAVTGVG